MKTSISDKLKKKSEASSDRWRLVRGWVAKQAKGISGASDEYNDICPYPQPHPRDVVKCLGDFPTENETSGSWTVVVVTRDRVIPYRKHAGYDARMGNGHDFPLNEGIEFTDEKSLRMALEKVYGFD
jgi:hypothetical protein